MVMSFVGRFKKYNEGGEKPRGARVYVHSSGLEDVFGQENTLEMAKTFFENSFRDAVGDKLFDYFIACIYGDCSNGRRVPAIDFFGFTGINVWPGNPDVYAGVYKGGIYSLGESPTCGDTLMLLGFEEFYRRMTMNLDQYLRVNPQIPELLGELKVDEEL